MIKALIKLAATILSGVLCFIIGKIVFLAINASLFKGIVAIDVLGVIYHGLVMDFSMAGYLTVIPAIFICISLKWGTNKIIKNISTAYFVLISSAVSLIVVLDAALYGYWLFKLDTTPFFYLFTSPGSALASGEWWMYAVAFISWIILGAIFFTIYYCFVIKLPGEIRPIKSGRQLIVSYLLMLPVLCVLFIVIRGGVTVSTMNMSRVYFSTDQRLNHAAVNPAFSLMYSASHQDNFASQFRFMDEQLAKSLFSELGRENELFAYSSGESSDSLSSLNGVKCPLVAVGSHPDIYLIILESFSSHLFPSLGGEPIALKLDSIAQTGLLYTNFFANSFRTDRGLVSILSGYPAQPNTSVMKFVDKASGLPSISESLNKAGYVSTYYYGGDGNFTNMRAYLLNSGFSRFVCDENFPVSKKLSKWGAHDEEVFDVAKKDIVPYDAGTPRFNVIQTSSSHEPFEVPYDDRGRFKDVRARAFAYADSCAAAFINSLRIKGDWDNTLVMLVPDHYGAYPDIENAIERHKIPFILTGGALVRKGKDDTYGAQTDIPATLLSALGIDYDSYIFSHDMSSPSDAHFGFFADPSRIGMISKSGVMVYNLDSNKEESVTGEGVRMLPYAKAYLQTLYDDLSKR